MTMWVTVLAAGLLAYAVKLGGYLVPRRVLQVPWVDRAVPLLTVALLSSLVITQGFLAQGVPTLDARAAGLAVAVVALVLRAPFLAVVALAALTAALVRLWS